MKESCLKTKKGKKGKEKKKENSLDLECPWKSDAPNPIP